MSLNENWDEDVREDMSDALDRIAPEDRKGELYRHSAEGCELHLSPNFFLGLVFDGFGASGAEGNREREGRKTRLRECVLC